MAKRTGHSMKKSSKSKKALHLFEYLRDKFPKGKFYAKMIIFLMIGVLISYILFIIAAWSQVGFWPYSTDPGQFPPIRYVLFLGMLAIILIPFITIYLIEFIRNPLSSFHSFKKGYRILLKSLTGIFIIALLLSSLVFPWLAGITLPFYAYTSKPYLTWSKGQDPSSSITICWHSSVIEKTEFYLGREKDTLLLFSPSGTERETHSLPYEGNENVITIKLLGKEFSQFHKVAIDGLQPNTTYYYKIRGQGDLYQFHTAPLPSSSYNFSIVFWSDPRTNNPYEGALKGISFPERILELEKERGKSPAFSICGGDIVSRGVDYQDWKLWLSDITEKDFASNRSHIVCPGNHERFDDVYALNFRDYYPYEQEPRIGSFCYSIDYSNVHLVVVDPWNAEHPWWGDSSDEIAQWLEEDLRMRKNGTDYTVIIIHPNPLYDGDFMGNNSALRRVLQNFQVDLVLCGHWHTYKTYTLNGTRLSTLSDHGYTFETFNENKTGWVIMCGMGGNEYDPSIAMYVELEFTSEDLRATSIFVNGTIFDQFIIYNK